MYTLKKPLYADKNNSMPDIAFVADEKWSKNFDTREEAQAFIDSNKNLLDPIIREINV
jgi:hypothetical protein